MNPLQALARYQSSKARAGDCIHLDAVDRGRMINYLVQRGVPMVAGMSDAYVAARYDAEWNEEDHPRDEHGKFGSGGGKPLAFEGGHASAPHGEYQAFHSNPGLKVLYKGKGAEEFHELPGTHATPGAAEKAAEEHHQGETMKRTAEAYQAGAKAYEASAKAKESGKAEDHDKAAVAHSEASDRFHMAGHPEQSSMHEQLAEQHTAEAWKGAKVSPMVEATASTNPADKLSPSMKAAGASAYAKEMSRMANRGTESHAAAAAAQRTAATQHRALGNESTAQAHEKKAAEHDKKAGAAPAPAPARDPAAEAEHAKVSATMHAGLGQSTPVDPLNSSSDIARSAMNKSMSEARTKGAEAGIASNGSDRKAAQEAHEAAAKAHGGSAVVHSLHEGAQARIGEIENRRQQGAHKSSAQAEKLSVKANQKSESSITREANHRAAAQAHETASSDHYQAGNLEQSARHHQLANEHLQAAAQAQSRPQRQAEFVKSEIESKVPGAKVTISEPNSSGARHMSIEHESSGAKHGYGVSKYGVTPSEVRFGSKYKQGLTHAMPTGVEKFEKVMNATLNKAKKLDGIDDFFGDEFDDLVDVDSD